MKLKSFSTLIICFILLLPVISCKKKSSPPPAVIALYKTQAQKFCKIITGCIQKDIKERLKDQPNRRDMVVNRMNRDLCHKNQINLLGSLQADPRGPMAQDYNKKLYQAYAKCVQQLEQAENCDQIKAQYNQYPACLKIRANPNT